MTESSKGTPATSVLCTVLDAMRMLSWTLPRSEGHRLRVALASADWIDFNPEKRTGMWRSLSLSLSLSWGNLLAECSNLTWEFLLQQEIYPVSNKDGESQEEIFNITLSPV